MQSKHILGNLNELVYATSQIKNKISMQKSWGAHSKVTETQQL